MEAVRNWGHVLEFPSRMIVERHGTHCGSSIVWIASAGRLWMI